jgi:hypothetical protein
LPSAPMTPPSPSEPRDPHWGFLDDASKMLVVVQEQERNPPGRRRGLLIGNSKGRLSCIAPDEEQRVGFASGAWWSYLGGIEVGTATIAVAVASVAAAVRRTFVSDQTADVRRAWWRGAAGEVGALVVE